jgi:hypothetical protein
MSRLRRLRRYWPVAAILFVALFIYVAWPGRSTYTISPETTYVTEPVDAQGCIDYPTALNERMAKDITPETNANVLIWKALGPHPEGSTLPPEYFKWLGIERPPEQGDYLLDWTKYFEANLKTPPDDVVALFGDDRDWKEHWDDCIERARKWPWKAKSQPAIAEWLKQNEKPLAVAIEASTRTKYFNPLVSKIQDPKQARLMGSLLPSVQKCREIANALKCRAMCRAGEGDFDGAWQDLLACQRLGRLMAHSGTLIETLVGIALAAIATDGELTLLSQCKCSPTQLHAWLDDLRALPPFPSLADKFDLGERFMTLDTMQSIACGGIRQLDMLAGGTQPGDPPIWDRVLTQSIDWDPAFRNANRMFDRLSAATQLPDHAARKREYAKIADEVKQGKEEALGAVGLFGITLSKKERGQAIGSILLGLLLPAIEKIQDATDRIEQTRCNLVIAFALAAYRADNGHYPAKLEELAPKYLSSVPGDLFSGKPLIYKPTEDGYLFYSVGINGIDDGGRWQDDEPKGDDLRVRMPVPEPVTKQKR